MIGKNYKNLVSISTKDIEKDVVLDNKLLSTEKVAVKTKIDKSKVSPEYQKSLKEVNKKLNYFYKELESKQDQNFDFVLTEKDDFRIIQTTPPEHQLFFKKQINKNFLDTIYNSFYIKNSSKDIANGINFSKDGNINYTKEQIIVSAKNFISETKNKQFKKPTTIKKIEKLLEEHNYEELKEFLFDEKILFRDLNPNDLYYNINNIFGENFVNSFEINPSIILSFVDLFFQNNFNNLSPREIAKVPQVIKELFPAPKTVNDFLYLLKRAVVDSKEIPYTVFNWENGLNLQNLKSYEKDFESREDFEKKYSQYLGDIETKTLQIFNSDLKNKESDTFLKELVGKDNLKNKDISIDFLAKNAKNFFRYTFVTKTISNDYTSVMSTFDFIEKNKNNFKEGAFFANLKLSLIEDVSELQKINFSKEFDKLEIFFSSNDFEKFLKIMMNWTSGNVEKLVEFDVHFLLNFQNKITELAEVVEKINIMSGQKNEVIVSLNNSLFNIKQTKDTDILISSPTMFSEKNREMFKRSIIMEEGFDKNSVDWSNQRSTHENFGHKISSEILKHDGINSEQKRFFEKIVNSKPILPKTNSSLKEIEIDFDNWDDGRFKNANQNLAISNPELLEPLNNLSRLLYPNHFDGSSIENRNFWRLAGRDDLLLEKKEGYFKMGALYEGRWEDFCKKLVQNSSFKEALITKKIKTNLSQDYTKFNLTLNGISKELWEELQPIFLEFFSKKTVFGKKINSMIKFEEPRVIFPQIFDAGGIVKGYSEEELVDRQICKFRDFSPTAKIISENESKELHFAINKVISNPNLSSEQIEIEIDRLRGNITTIETTLTIPNSTEKLNELVEKGENVFSLKNDVWKQIETFEKYLYRNLLLETYKEIEGISEVSKEQSSVFRVNFDKFQKDPLNETFLATLKMISEQQKWEPERIEKLIKKSLELKTSLTSTQENTNQEENLKILEERLKDLPKKLEKFKEQQFENYNKKYTVSNNSKNVTKNLETLIDSYNLLKERKTLDSTQEEKTTLTMKVSEEIGESFKGEVLKMKNITPDILNEHFQNEEAYKNHQDKEEIIYQQQLLTNSQQQTSPTNQQTQTKTIKKPSTGFDF
ncbi:MAG: hypothetical protein ACRC4M_04985 [Mycoplasma sp.]